MPTPSEAIRAYFDAWNRRDVEAIGAGLHPDAEWETSGGLVEGSGRVLRGREEVVAFAESMFDVFEVVRADLTEVTNVDEDATLVRGVSSFMGKLSGAESKSSWVRIYEMRDGLIWRIRPYAD